MLLENKIAAEVRYTVSAYLDPISKYGWYDGLNNDDPSISKVQDDRSLFIVYPEWVGKDLASLTFNNTVGGMFGLFTSQS